jgi:hypothetical protein
MLVSVTLFYIPLFHDYSKLALISHISFFFVFMLSLFFWQLKNTVYSIVKSRKEELARDFQMLLERHFSLMSESIFSAVSEHFNSSKPGVPLTSEVAVDKGVSANADGSEASPHGDIPVVNKQGTKSSEVAVDKGVSANADGCESNSHGDTDRIADTQGTTDAIIAGKSVIVGEEHRCH